MKPLYHLAFSHFLGIGPIRFKQLLAKFNSAEKAYRGSIKDLREVLGVKLTENFAAFRQRFEPDRILKTLAQKKIQLLILEDQNYPKQLAQISDPPICLYVKGNADILTENDDKILLAVVGTRKPTSYGLSATVQLTRELTQYGFIIVSGMAIGIDTQAHQTAMENKTPTIAVLGCGVDIIYPPANRDLYQQIIAKGGAVVSEFPPGQTVHPGLFVARNRIISGLARGVLVVEGGIHSGASITARYAAEQGRDVFALPSMITSPQSATPHMLIKQGAKITTSVEDILEEYAVKIKTAEKENILEKLSGLDKELVMAVIHEPQTADELALICGKPITEVLHSLSLLEIQSVVSKNQEGKFFKK